MGSFYPTHTSLPHTVLKLKLGSLIRNTFLPHTLIKVDKRKAFFLNKECRDYHKYSAAQFVALLCVLINTFYMYRSEMSCSPDHWYTNGNQLCSTGRRGRFVYLRIKVHESNTQRQEVIRVSR